MFDIAPDKLTQYAESTAKCLDSDCVVRGKRITGRISLFLKRLTEAAEKCRMELADSTAPRAVAEWLADNRFLAEKEARSAAAAFKGAGMLPAASEDRIPLVCAAASAFVHACGCKVDRESLMTFFEGFQKIRPFSEKELSLLFDSIRYALVEKVVECGQRAFSVQDDAGDPAFIASAVFSSLRYIDDADADEILRGLSQTERRFLEDPADVYGKMDKESRRRYRMRLSDLAGDYQLSERAAAEQILALAGKENGIRSHIGYWLFEKPLGHEGKNKKGSVYIGSIIIATVSLSLLAAFLSASPAAALLFIVPISELIKCAADYIILKFTRPSYLPRLELKTGIPQEGRTLCVVSAVLTDPESALRFTGLLERCMFSNKAAGSELRIALLADLKEADAAQVDSDSQILSAVKSKVNELNSRYGERFLALVRPRKMSSGTKKYCGWERKRGAIESLVSKINGMPSDLYAISGDIKLLDGVKYLILLDTDTRPGIDTARKLIGAMLHPLNRPVIDEATRTVISGYGVMQPRNTVSLDAAGRSIFSEVFAGQGGFDPYCGCCGDLYQDVFNEGNFTGKGVLSVEAYTVCLNGRLPPERILSHDLLEGSYLRCGYINGVEFADGFPSSPMAYYERQDRWTRGDWQLLPWLTRYVKNARGKTEHNPLTEQDRWKIADNLRRSLVPVLCALCVAAAILSDIRALFAAAIVSALAISSPLITGQVEQLFRRPSLNAKRYRSEVLSGLHAAYLQTLIKIALLPYEAFVCLRAALTALYRQFVSKKNMLKWVTAAESENRKGSLISCVLRMYPAVIAGAILAVFSQWPAGSALGIVWFFSPLTAYLLSKPSRKRMELSKENKEFLRKNCADMWRFFETFLTPERNYMPPDNWQEDPPVGVAERTSPTDIGMAMLSVLAAWDMGLCDCQKARTLLGSMVSSIERMEKWNGHLFNWYDTRKLIPLEPRYVSSVDSGNLAGAYIALCAGTIELNDIALSERIRKLLNEMRFEPLYDSEKKLFLIGKSISGNENGACYDLLASEARLLSYITIAKGQAESSHWRRLGRVMSSAGLKSGMASWTGTMFEYFMPELLLPYYRNSLVGESLRFCLYCQRRRGRPWGESESAFFAFDAALNYRYKAHGIRELALKRDAGSDRVCAPYATYLTLPLAPAAAVRNLKRFRKAGCEGRFGFYEALDITPARTGSEGFKSVRCFMAHHLGMSLAAADNALNNNIMVRRFMSDPEMEAHTELLQEKGPVGQFVATEPVREIPDRYAFRSTEVWEKVLDKADKSSECSFISNGKYSVMLYANGRRRSVFGDILIASPGGHYGPGEGISFWFVTGGIAKPLTPYPFAAGDMEYSCSLSLAGCGISARGAGFLSKTETYVPDFETGEVHSLTLVNTGEGLLSGELAFYMQPVLAAEKNHYSHQSFSKLCVQTAYKDGTLTVKRRKGGAIAPITLSIKASEPFTYDTFREKTCGRGAGRALPYALLKKPENSCGDPLDPCVLIRFPVKIKPSSEKKIFIALGVGTESSEASESAARLLLLCGKEKMYWGLGAASRFGLSAQAIEAAMELAARLNTGEKTATHIEKQYGRKDLWKYGVSGDFLVYGVHVNEADAEKMSEFMREHGFLKSLGFSYDLVFMFDDKGEYRRPVRTRFETEAMKEGLESQINARGGIFAAEGSEQELSGLVAMCDAISNNKGMKRSLFSYEPIRPLMTNVAEERWRHFDKDGSFTFTTERGIGPLAWCHVLTNGGLGWLAADCGTFGLWIDNARESRLLPWINDPLRAEGSERIYLRLKNNLTGVFAQADDIGCRVTYGYGWAEWEKTISGTRVVTVGYVHPDINARVLIIKADTAPENTILEYSADPIPGSESIAAKTVNISVQKNGIRAVDNESGLELSIMSSRPVRAGEGFSFFCDMSGTIVLVCGCGDSGKLQQLADEYTAEAGLQRTKQYWRALSGFISVQTPFPELDSYINGWCIYQSLACRILGRCSQYQSGGAFGFRDQLQDVCALTPAFPGLAELQILSACAHQYEEGDVMHWWHVGRGEDNDRGVRTRCSDDMLWLPFAVSRYCNVTGDLKILEKSSCWLISSPLEVHEADRYEQAVPSERESSIYDHCMASFGIVQQRGTGKHGLLLIGTGDWNDGFSRVGAGGLGESVWLTWFASLAADTFSRLCSHTGRERDAQHLRELAHIWAKAADESWDTDRYLRGYFDDGSALGAGENEECRIDSIAQSFAVLSGMADGDKCVKALETAFRELYDSENALTRLFTPPFDSGSTDPGYIRSYIPGVRENGGQYTHAAIWLAIALLRIDRREEATRLLLSMLPSSRDDSVYMVEPYVLAADIYSNTAHPGRGGWSWYTGAAGWYYIAVVEELLGIKYDMGKLSVKPRIPESWDGFKAVVSTARTNTEIVAVKGKGSQTEISVHCTDKNTESTDKEMFE